MAPTLLTLSVGLSLQVLLQPIATDSEKSMRQIKKQIRYPILHTYYIHHSLLGVTLLA